MFESRMMVIDSMQEKSFFVPGNKDVAGREEWRKNEGKTTMPQRSKPLGEVTGL